MRFYDGEHPHGIEITPVRMGLRLREAASTRGPEDNPSQPVKVFLFYNLNAIVDYLMLGTD